MQDNIKLLKNYLLYFLVGVLICMVGLTNVFAYTYTNIGDKADITVVLVSTAYGSQPFNVPKNTGYNFTEVLQLDYLINNYSFEANKHYQLETHLTSQTLTNANKYIVTGLNGEQCLTDYSASIFTGSYPRWDFQCPHATSSITITISNNANQYLWNNGVYTWTTALLKSTNESIPVSSDTQDIINNQTQNTQNIINNQNQNTQQIIDRNKVCENVSKYDKEFDGYLYDNGQIGTNIQDSIVTKYFEIDSNSTLTKIDDPLMDGPAYRICFYDSNKNYISCLVRQNYYGITDIPIPDNSSFVRFTINSTSDVPKFKICKNGNQAVNDTSKGILAKIKELFSWFTNNDNADVSGLNNMVGWLPPGPVDSIINLPLSFFNALTNTLSGTCQNVSLNLPFINQTLTLYCFDAYMTQYLTHFGTFWTLVGFIASVFILYNYLLSLYKWVDDTLTFRENNLPGYYGDNWGGGA